MKRLTYIALLLALTSALGGTASAKKRKPPARARSETTDLGGGAKATSQSSEGDKVKVYDFTGLSLSGRLRTPQLMYFLNRIRQELEAGTLDKRSFMPELARSVNDDAL